MSTDREKKMNRITVHIPRDKRVLLLEDDPRRVEWFRQRICQLDHADSVEGAIALLSNNRYDFVFLDHDLGTLHYAGEAASLDDKAPGQAVAKHLASLGWIGDNVVIHSWNPDGAKMMKNLLRNAYAIPFGNFEVTIE